MTRNSLFEQVRQEALRLGLDDLAIIAASDSVSLESFKKWLASGSGSSMDYLEKNLSARRHPSGVFPNVRTLLVAVLSLARIAQDFPPVLNKENGFLTTENHSYPDSPITGKIVPYALYPDYHDILKKKLLLLLGFLKNLRPEIEGRAVVDTAPLPEKEWAVRAGLGTIGRQSLLIHPKFGCSIFIGTLLVSLDYEQFGPWPSEKLPPLKFPQEDCCAGCCQCLRKCPTNAIRPDRTIDGRKCLNFWTIENRNFDPADIPKEIKSALKNRLFGCDECTQACRWNQINNTVPSGEVDLALIEKMTDEEFKDLFRKTPIYRAMPAGLKRNAHWIKNNF